MDHIKKRPGPNNRLQGGDVVQAVLPEPNMIEQMSPWQMNFRQIEPGPMQTCVKVRRGKILSLLEISMDRAVHQQGAAPPGTLTFGFSLSGGRFRWRGAEMQKERFLTFGSGDGFEGHTDHAFHGVTFSVVNADIEALADRVGIPVEESLRSSGVFTSAQASNDIQHIGECALDYLQTDVRKEMDVNDEEEMLALFLQIAAHPSHHNDQSTGHDRARAVRVALEFIEANIEDNVPVSRVCEAAGVSMRTLRRAFHESFGVGPKAYILRMRLGLLRRALLDKGRYWHVSDAANQFGFWHMGQMAQDYRAIFGELPSETSNQIGRWGSR